MKEGADWLKHDTDMRNDPKIKALRRKFKHEGYSIWNMILEVLARAEEFKVIINPLQIELLAGDFDCEPDLLFNIIEYAIHIDLLKKDVAENIFSSGLKKRLNGMVEKRTRLKESYESKKVKINSATEIIVEPIILPQENDLTIKPAEEIIQSRVEESRVEYKENIERDTDPVAGKSTFILTVNTEKIYDLKKYSAENFQTACERAGMKLNGKYEERFSAFEDRVCGLSYPNVNEVVRYFNNFMNLPESKYQQEKLKPNGTKNTTATASFTNGNREALKSGRDALDAEADRVLREM